MNLFQKLKVIFIKPKLTKEEAIQKFKENHRKFMQKGDLNLGELADSIRALKENGFGLEEVLALRTEAEEELKTTHTTEKDSNVITLH